MSDQWVVGKRLRTERRRLGVSLAELADMTGVSKSYLVRLEQDANTNPSLNVLRRVADALEITVADLVGTRPVRFVADETTVPQSLLAFADERQLRPREFETLASIRWRRGEEPQTSERWDFILKSLRASKQFDEEH